MSPFIMLLLSKDCLRKMLQRSLPTKVDNTTPPQLKDKIPGKMEPMAQHWATAQLENNQTPAHWMQPKPINQKFLQWYDLCMCLQCHQQQVLSE